MGNSFCYRQHAKRKFCLFHACASKCNEEIKIWKKNHQKVSLRQQTREKKVKEKFSKPLFFTEFENRSRDEKGAIFKLRKKSWHRKLFLYLFPSSSVQIFSVIGLCFHILFRITRLLLSLSSRVIIRIVHSVYVFLRGYYGIYWNDCQDQWS